nr:biotin--[acetyl-CoA-carboxylase] ligase [Sphingomicrobium lutaoense]
MSKIRLVEVTGSTNADLLADVAAAEGDWLIARRQDAGRGRQGREWQSIDGNFLGSTLVRLHAGDPSPATLSLVAGLALADAVEAAAPQADIQLKWPNDLLLDGKKVAGILAERSDDRIVIGFGVNLAGAPEIEGRPATSLKDHLSMTPQAFAPILAGSFARLLAAWRGADPASLVMAWIQKAHPIGSELAVHDSEGGVQRGRFAGLEADGALRLEDAKGEVTIVRAGDVTLDSPASAG